MIDEAVTAESGDASTGPRSIPGAPVPRRPRPGWLTAPWLMLLLPVLASGVDAVLVSLDSPWWERGLAALATLSLLLRRRYPVLVLLLTLPGAFLTFVWIAPITAVYSVASRRSRPWVATLCAIAFALVEFFHWPLSDHPLALNRDNALYAIQCMMLGAAPAALGLLARTRRELAVRLDELTKGQQRESRLLAERVLATERARLAREMHDVVSHQVSLISIQAGALQVSTGDPAAKATAVTIRELAVRTLEELRQMVGVLRAAGMRPEEPLAPQPRLADLPRLIEDSGLHVTSELCPGDRPWPEAVERAAYRTVQEALTNITKHAPGATVEVRLASRGTRLTVEVHNGCPPQRPGPARLPGGGHGLVGLRERAQLLGGAFAATPTPDGGFTVRAELPAAGD
ncbi:sensor histidine kinase [Kitasatospora sp. GP82]|uniref:sensor histidine kinase n=1 Tax=Kitasatospora sp. GP82 TaxID=3035089 RepID=UPI00247628A1|nr:sensor histidine kinase [Kitasatospora sp. GP82]MDH6127620.1 signal transduction histidine kinase [Kitasatospora sp. GP82]